MQVDPPPPQASVLWENRKGGKNPSYLAGTEKIGDSSGVSPSYVIAALLRYNSPLVPSTHLKCTLHWHVGHSQSCVTATTIHF